MDDSEHTGGAFERFRFDGQRRGTLERHPLKNGPIFARRVRNTLSRRLEECIQVMTDVKEQRVEAV